MVKGKDTWSKMVSKRKEGKVDQNKEKKTI